MVGQIVSVFIAVVVVAGLGVLLSNGNAASIVKAIFDGFSNSLKAALGH